MTSRGLRHAVRELLASARQRELLVPAVTALTATALAVLVNLATDAVDSLLPWIGVAALTGVSAVLSALDARRRAGDTGTDRAAARHATGAAVVDRRRSTVSGWLAVAVAVVLFASTGLVVHGLGDDGTPSAPEASATDVPGAPTVTVLTTKDVCLNQQVVSASPAELLSVSRTIPPPRGGDWRDWPPAREGIDASPAYVRLVVQGVGTAQVVLTDIRVRVVGRAASPKGTGLSGACGDGGVYRQLDVDLDRDPPRAVSQQVEGVTLEDIRAEGQPEWSIAPIRFPYEVALDDAESFLVSASTSASDVTWVIEVDWVSAGNRGTIRADDDGRPFRTIGTRSMPSCGVINGALQCGE